MSASARSDGDKPQPVAWNGDYVEVQNRGGNTLKVYFDSGRARIEGP